MMDGLVGEWMSRKQWTMTHGANSRRHRRRCHECNCAKISFTEPPEIFENVRTKYRLPAGTKTFKLSCPVKTKSDDDTVMVRWSKDEELISNDWSSHYKLLNSNRELKIRNVQLSDGGRFKCMVINGFGHREVEFSLDVYGTTHRHTVDFLHK